MASKKSRFYPELSQSVPQQAADAIRVAYDNIYALREQLDALVAKVNASATQSASTAAAATATKASGYTGAGNQVVATPDGVMGVATLRMLSAKDIPGLDAAKIISGRFAMARLASGTPDGTKYIRDDGTLQPVALSGPAGGDLTGTYPNPIVAKIAGTAITGTTGTGNVVLDTNPVITGNAAIANAEVGALVVDTSLSFGAVPGIGVYASNAAALAAGLPVGRVYRNGDNLCIVH